MRKIALCILLTLVFSMNCFACEFGKTYKDFYGKPNSYDYGVMNDGGVYYFPYGEDGILNPKGTMWERVHFKDGMINIGTPYTGVAGLWGIGGQKPFPEDKTKIPYVVYKGHRWYPQYHGFIYVYEDGREKE